MRQRAVRGTWIAGVLALGVTACGPSPLMRRASAELHCPVADIVATRLGGGSYTVRGCGGQFTYTCVGNVCVHDEPTSGGASFATTAPAPATHTYGPSSPWSNDDVRAMLGDIHDDVLACFAGEHVPASIRVIVGRTGRITDHGMVSEASDAELACAGGVLERVSLAGAPHAPRVVVLSFAPRSQQVVGTDASTADALDVETELRAAIDARAPTILECTDHAAVVVAVSWDAAGATAVTVRGRLHGAPEEGCIAHALAGVSVPQGVPAGALLHPISP
ncbi:MAG: hypothetical protein U0234_21910 [Sandaracinus sp.]